MAPPTTQGGSSLLGPRTIAAFVVGVGVGLALVAPALPDSAGEQVVVVLSSGGDVILAGVGALALLMVLLAMFYHLYL